MRRYLFLLIVLCLHIAARGQIITDAEIPVLSVPIEAQSLQYWFDTDADNKQTVSGLTGNYTLDVSSLNDGIHTLYYQVVGTDGNGYGLMSDVFLKIAGIEEPTVGANIAAANLQYWFDGDTENMQAVNGLSGVYTLDVSALEDGLHTLHYQVAGTDGNGYGLMSDVFLKISGMEEPTVGANIAAANLQYWFDGDTENMQTVNCLSGLYTLDVSALEDGLHTLYYQVIGTDGIGYGIASEVFIKMINSIVEPTVGVANNHIIQYKYWLNDNSATMQTVTLDNASNPYSLITLLPIKKEPVRSSCFLFETKNGKPMMYAKNDFHIRFYDAAGYFVDSESKQIIDYSVSREVNPVSSLEGFMGNVSLNSPASNDVIWYTMQAAPGDTAAFKLSQPATVQVFAPSGEEVFKTSEYESVNWGGIHTWEDGTYYVAVHDVTGTRPTMTLDYMHMDKYDVVDWDVHTVGNGGCSTITFKGNGFKDLYAVDLYTADGDSIHSVDISHDSDAETAVTFDFSDAELGVYDAVFHFTQEDKHFANIVTVEEAVDIELATNVSFPSTFLRGTSTTYTIKITNKGNMTAYNVPIYTFIRNSSRNGISYIRYYGLNLPNLFSEVDRNILSQSDYDELYQYSDELGHDAYFNKVWTYDEEMKDSVMVRTNYFFKNIEPNTTIVLSLTIKSDDNVDVWVTTPNVWPAIGEPTNNYAYSRAFKNSLSTAKDYYCCYIESINCALDLFSIGCDLVTPVMGVLAIQCPEIAPELLAGSLATGIMGCASSVTSDGIRTFTESICSSEGNLADRIKNGLLGGLKSSLSINNVIGCVSNVLSLYADVIPKGVVKNALNAVASSISVNSIYGDAKKLSSDNFSCKSMLKKKPGCPPNPGGGGGSSTPQPPVDPNDIYGYLSEAGSKFMTDEVAKVNYTIEFENDTTFAQAAAHTIAIRDTLDSRYFDLKSFVPTSVKIGEHETFLDEATDVKTADGVTSFLKTIDMRPEINAIAQVEGEYSQQTGIAKWTFTSLDPMTMEPTDDLMQGVLPVNYDGTSGIGEVMFEVGVKPNKGHGTEIKNRASIVFDYEEPILTPMWVNTVDAIAPVSRVSDVQQLNDSVAVVSIDASDELSGVWRYDVYVQYGEGSGWWKAAENVPIDTVAYVKIYEGIDHGFYVVATDSAGNVEVKVPAREWPKSDNDDIPTIISKSSTVNDPFYDLQGKRVKQPKKGIFIRRGKKEVKR